MERTVYTNLSFAVIDVLIPVEGRDEPAPARVLRFHLSDERVIEFAVTLGDAQDMGNRLAAPFEDQMPAEVTPG